MLLVIQVFKSNAHFELHAYFSQPGNYGYIKEGKKSRPFAKNNFFRSAKNVQGLEVQNIKLSKFE